MDNAQLLISGLANGCVYGLIALGFVLIYKATEAVNFAQGDFMMLGAFVTIGLTNTEYMGLPFWLALPISLGIMGVLGYLVDRLIIRRLFGEPYSTWDAAHFAKSLLAGLEGDIRVRDDTIVVTYYNAPNVPLLREHYESLPDRLEREHVDPHIPWLYGFKLDFCFR